MLKAALCFWGVSRATVYIFQFAHNLNLYPFNAPKVKVNKKVDPFQESFVIQSEFEGGEN